MRSTKQLLTALVDAEPNALDQHSCPDETATYGFNLLGVYAQDFFPSCMQAVLPMSDEEDV